MNGCKLYDFQGLQMNYSYMQSRVYDILYGVIQFCSIDAILYGYASSLANFMNLS